ncbi:Error-prone DNA polymerase 2 [Isoalcanivorax pacificus W11-5]|uniref:Error-prone DNA polymerase n=1 Tax=Isoalcanivorax pacificus W11-5 TaxID=391936 RepID=A0A0B4XN90_9GAMM|nr:error-prone DNA polymerase [Isoalcanivorax pacificus]AJD47777.1 Error-prone DNA polymerase 2 [Isoalcanivorax pacificus W11-5]
MFAELHVTTSFTFLTGASQPEELVHRALALGYSALAITDECSLAGVVRAWQAARDTPLHLIIGSRVRLTGEPAPQVILLAPDNFAYANLCQLITLARRDSDKGQYRVTPDMLAAHSAHLLCLWLPGPDASHHDTELRWLSDLFPDRLWIGCALLQDTDDAALYQQLYQLACTHHLPMVACNDVHMHDPQRQPLLDVLTALRHHTTVQTLGSLRFANAERHLRPLARLRAIYPPALLQESLRIAGRCTFRLDTLRYHYPREVVPEGLTAAAYLRQLVDAGAARRWPGAGMPAAVRRQVEQELTLIRELEYEYYFLTVHDIVAFARSQDIFCQGRGSAANSAVCYCLGITEVDPSRSQLLFERFLSRERDEPPDIDVDFEHERREEVIQYIYRKYGRERAALAATVISYRLRSAIRDVGRALGFDQHRLALLSKQLAWWDKPETLPERFREAGLKDTHLARLFQARVVELLGFPRHLSQHVGGFVISQPPLATLVPVENAAMPDRTIIQWDKDDLEALGLMKVDVLALGMLTAIRKMLGVINRYRMDAGRTPLTVQDIPAEDPATYDMLCKADSVGVFQVESRAQMSMLPRLKPRRFYDLVIQVAIVRPGPIQGDMVHPFLRRRAGLEAVDYPDQRIENVLCRTLGIPIFQEQVIQMAMVAANFTGGEADQLRRAMARWGKSGELLQFRDKVIHGMLGNGYSPDYAERIFEQMKGFGGYGFPESHSASFALLVYLSAWLKRHHTSAFYCGLLNSLPMGFYSPSQLLQDARRHGIEVRPPCVDHSHWDYTLEDTRRQPLGMQPAVRVGLRQISGFNEDAAQRILQARRAARFTDVADLCARARLNRREREALVAANAIARLTGHRHQGQWEILAVQEPPPLFDQPVHSSNLRDGVRLDAPSEVDNLLADYRSLSLTLGRHPMALVRHRTPFDRCQSARDLRRLNQGRFVRVAGVVTNRQRPGTASGVLFLTLEDETGNTSVIVWRTLQERCRKAILSGQLLVVKGTLEKTEEGVIHVIAGEILDESHALAELKTRSRDFH